MSAILTIAGCRSGLLKNLPLLLASLLLSACASVSVRDVQHARTAPSSQPQGAPRQIAVIPFSLQNAKIAAGHSRDPAQPQRVATKARDALSAALVKELSKNIAPATVASEGVRRTSEDTWLVSGQITRIAEGNKLLRMGIGLGAGGTKFETQVQVRRGSIGNPPFLSFSTTGGSNATPGAATNPIPYSSLPSAIMGATAGLNDDAARTARMITSTVAEYLVQHGWMAPGKVPKPKMQRQ